MDNILGAVVLFVVAIACFVLSIFQFKQKGFLLNNAYIYASEESENMDKKPYYRQTGIVFIFTGIVFLITAIEMIVYSMWLFYTAIVVAIIAVVYAIVSSVVISTSRSKK